MSESDDKTLEDLVRKAGPRARMPELTRQRLETSFKAELATARKLKFRRMAGWVSGMAASLVLAVFLLVGQGGDSRAPALANVDRTSGDVFWRNGKEEGPLRAGNALRVGDLVTTESGWLALQPNGGGVDVRLDRFTHIEFIDEETIRLHRGRIYVDAFSSPGENLTILADGVSIEHIGTQYLVTADSDGIAVAVREGEVSVVTSKQTLHGVANTEVAKLFRIDVDHAVSESDIPRQGSPWAWVNRVSPAFSTPGKSTAEFLEWFGRETGYRIVYASDQLEQAAKIDAFSATPIPTLDAFAALDEAMRVTGFRAVFEDGVVVVR